MANVILLWSDILLGIKFSKLKSYFFLIASKDSERFFMIIITYFLSGYCLFA